MADVVGVHGIFQYKYHRDPEVLAKVWRDALEDSAGISPDEFALAYYSPELRSGVAQGGADFEDLSPRDAAIIGEWLRLAGVPGAMAQGPVTAWLRDGLDWLIESGRARGVTRAMASSVLREVAAYTDRTNPEPRSRVTSLVAELIRREQPRVVIAHSLGSVVTYEALWRYPDLKVPLLVTVGSPLALPDAFYDTFVPRAAASHERPPGVGRWANFADVGDVVAVPKYLKHYFEGIDIDETVEIDLFECHKIVQYLACPPIAKVIRGGMS